MISTQKALVELKAATGERNEYSALHTSWADWSREHLDSQIERGTRRTSTDRQHLTPETYGLAKDKARSADGFGSLGMGMDWRSIACNADAVLKRFRPGHRPVR